MGWCDALSDRLRTASATLVGIAVLAGIVAQLPFVDVESGSRNGASNHEQVWGGSLAVPGNWTQTANATAPTVWHSYYDSFLDDSHGITALRWAGPLLGLSLFVLLAALVLVQGRQALAGGVTGMAGAALLGGGIILLLLGLSDFNRYTDDGTRFALHLSIAFYVLVGAAVLGLAGGILAIAQPGGKEGQLVGNRPVLSTETPNAFNPLQSRDPIPFKPDPPREFKEFKVLDPPKPEGEAAPEGQAPTTPPGDSPPAKPKDKKAQS